ncbi:MAG TPA: ABC transporter permease, partial [Planctomycetota bacterium]|nr:ABC transporter permease [Planctomycetota bacterium]
RELLLARARQFYREPETIFWVYFFPLLLMGGLGLAFRTQTEISVRARILADDPRIEAAIRQRLESAGGVEILENRENAEDPDRNADEKRVDRSSVGTPSPMPRSLSPSVDATVIASGRVEGPGGEPWPETIELRFDPSMPEGRLARERIERVIRAALAPPGSPRIETRKIEIRGARYVDWLLPGLLGLNIMGGGLYGVGFVSVDMRIRKLLKRLRATPMLRSDFLLSLIGGRLIFLLPEISILLLVGWLAFGIAVEGSILSVFIVGFVGAAAFAGIGLLLASRARKLETMSGLLNLTMFPMWLLGDVFFAADRFPAAMQPFLAALPLNQLNSALRTVILDGGSLVDTLPSLGIVLVWGAVAFPLAIRFFRWQ